MSNTTTTALSFIGSDKDRKPVYELAAERILMLFMIRHSNHKLDIGVAFKPYATDRAIQLLQDRQICWVPAKDEKGATDLDRASLQIDHAFFDEHKLSVVFNGAEVSAEELVRLDTLYNFRAMALNIGLNGIHTEVDEEIQSIKEGLTLSDVLGEDLVVNQYIHLADETWREYRVDVAQHFSEPNPDDVLNYRKSHKVRTLEDGSQKVGTNHKAIVKIYRNLIDGLDGFVIHGQPCTHSNKAEWEPLVPFFFKQDAMRQLFRGTERKNV